MLLSSHSSFKYIGKAAHKKLDYLKNNIFVKEVVLCYDLSNDLSDFSLNGIYIKTETLFLPIAAGFDIGCGFNVTHTKVKVSQLISQLANSDLFDWDNKSINICSQTTETQLPKSIELGYLAAGNHFVELRKVKNINNSRFAKELNIERDDIFIIIHNGINTTFKKAFMKYFVRFMNRYNPNLIKDEDNGYLVSVPIRDIEASIYFRDVGVAVRISKINRKYIRDCIVTNIGATSVKSFDMPHETLIYKDNFVEHFKGCQKFSEFYNWKIAYIAVDDDKNDFLVSQKDNVDYINHGVCYEELEQDSELFKNSLLNEYLPYSSLIELEPIAGMKNGVVTKWI